MWALLVFAIASADVKENPAYFLDLEASRYKKNERIPVAYLYQPITFKLCTRQRQYYEWLYKKKSTHNYNFFTQKSINV
jgi:hypothetical protein